MEETLSRIILAIGGLGIFLTYLGWFRRRSDGGSYCRACGYRIDRSGENSARCSECGLVLNKPGRVLPYQRNRNLLLVVFGILLILGSGFVVLTDATRRISAADVYRMLPTWYLLRADVSPESDFADEQVSVMRRRVQVETLSAQQLRDFTALLGARAANLHRQSSRGAMQYTGMTMSLLRDYKPSAAAVDDLLAALVGRLVESSGSAVAQAGGAELRVWVPELRCDPVRPFRRATDLTAVRMRGEIVSWRLIPVNGGSGGGEGGSADVSAGLLPTGAEFVAGQGWRATFARTSPKAGGFWELRLGINWYIESAELPVPPTGMGTGEPWHTFELIWELKPDSSAGAELYPDYGDSAVAENNGNRYLIIPKRR